MAKESVRKGVACSEVVTIVTTLPPGDRDKAAIEWVHSAMGSSFDQQALCYVLYAGRGPLTQRFPDSHVTYVGSLGIARGYAGEWIVGHLEKLLQAQPNHPLASETRLYLALVKLYQGIPFPLKEEMAKLPPGLAAYLEQESQPKPTGDRAPCLEFNSSGQDGAPP